jgi:predicted HD phosphohydrolase
VILPANLHEEGNIRIDDRHVHESAGEVLQARIRSTLPSFLASHVSAPSRCASKVQLARTGPVRA